MLPITLRKIDGYVVDFYLSSFEDSCNCSIILTSQSLIIGFLSNFNNEVKWNIFKEIKLERAAYVAAISPCSKTLIPPTFIKLVFADCEGIHIVNIHDCNEEESTEHSQTVLKGDFEVTTVSFNHDGDRIAFAGYDKKCHILTFQSEALSECDSMVSDAVTEGGYRHGAVQLSSGAVRVQWHPRRIGYLVVLEMGGCVRFLVAAAAEEDAEAFVCEYVINLGYVLPLPLLDIDFVSDPSYDFVVAGSGGLCLFSIDKPLSSLHPLQPLPSTSAKRRQLGSCSRVALSPSLGAGGLLATVTSGPSSSLQAVQQQHRLVITDIALSKTVEGGISDCVSIQWHQTMPLILAATTDSLQCLSLH